MVYLNDIPRRFDRRRDSCPEIQENFEQLYNLVAVNHIGFNETGAGKHFFVEIPVIPLEEDEEPPQTIANEVALISTIGKYSNQPELAVQRQKVGDVNGKVSIFTETNTNHTWTRLPSGLLIQWGFQRIPPLGNSSYITTSIVLNYVNAPAFTSIINIQLTQYIITNFIEPTDILNVNSYVIQDSIVINDTNLTFDVKTERIYLTQGNSYAYIVDYLITGI